MWGRVRGSVGQFGLFFSGGCDCMRPKTGCGVGAMSAQLQEYSKSRVRPCRDTAGSNGGKSVHVVRHRSLAQLHGQFQKSGNLCGVFTPDRKQ